MLKVLTRASAFRKAIRFEEQRASGTSSADAPLSSLLAPDAEGLTPLMLACKHGHEGAARVLLNARTMFAIPLKKQAGGDNPLTLAAERGERDEREEAREL